MFCFFQIKSDPKTFKQQTTQKSKQAQQLYEWQLPTINPEARAYTIMFAKGCLGFLRFM